MLSMGQIEAIGHDFKVSFSGISTYLKCGKQYWFSYVQGIKAPPGIAMIEGSAHHKAVEKNNNHKRQKGKDLKPGILTDVFMEDFRQRTGKGGKALDWEGQDEDVIFSRAKELHNQYIKTIAPRINPEGVEEDFEIPVKLDSGKEFILRGTIDLTVPWGVWDYKTLAKAKSQFEVDSSLQLSYYAMAAQKRKVGFIQFLKKANPEVGLVSSSRTRQDFQWAIQVAKEVVESVRRGAFPLTDPKNWWCSEKWCGYWSQCRGKVK